MRKPVFVPICVVLACGVGIGACGSSSSSSQESSKEPSTNAAEAPIALSGAVNNHGDKDVSAAADAQLELEADDVYFAPTFVKAAPGATVTVELHNEGKMEHTFTIDGTTVDQDVQPGEKADVEVTIPQDGALQFHCRFHDDQGMQGAFYTSAGAAVSNGSDGSGDAGSSYGY